MGVHGIALDAEVELFDSPDLGLSDDATVQDVLDALDATGDVYFVIELAFFSEEASAVQWLAFGSETYWFGTDTEWFLNDPSCGTIVRDSTPEPQPTPEYSSPAPKKPIRVETGL